MGHRSSLLSVAVGLTALACVMHGRPRQVAFVPLVVECDDATLRSAGLVLPPDGVETVAHAIRCPSGVSPTRILADGYEMQVERYDGERVRLVATRGEPWRRLPWPQIRTPIPGMSGMPLLDGDGAVICLLKDRVGDELVRCVRPNPDTLETSVTVEGPRGGFTLEDLGPPYGPGGCWPECIGP